jgi:hypothetical protein
MPKENICCGDIYREQKKISLASQKVIIVACVVEAGGTIGVKTQTGDLITLIIIRRIQRTRNSIKCLNCVWITITKKKHNRFISGIDL